MLSPTLLHSFLHFNFYLYFRTKSILVVVAISVEVPAALEEFAHFHGVLFRVAYLIVEDQHLLQEQLDAEGDAGDVDAAAVALDVIDLVNINRVPLIVDDVEEEAFLLGALLALAFDQATDELGLGRSLLHYDVGVLIQDGVKDHS